jgi:hypothetical protein
VRLLFASGPQLLTQFGFCRENWVRFAKNIAGRFSPLLLRRFSKTHTWSATVLVDELDPGFFKRSSYDIEGRATWFAALVFELVDGHDADARSISQVLLGPI